MKTLETKMGMKLDGITRLPAVNLYEVRVGDDVFYADPGGNYILVGNLIDVRTRENLTRNRVEEIKQASLPPFKFAEMPFDAAVKVVKGSGKRKVAIFEDPNCGYCKRLEKAILDIGDVTVYVFLYPVLGPDSLVKSKQVWCASRSREGVERLDAERHGARGRRRLQDTHRQDARARPSAEGRRHADAVLSRTTSGSRAPSMPATLEKLLAG